MLLQPRGRQDTHSGSQPFIEKIIFARQINVLARNRRSMPNGLKYANLLRRIWGLQETLEELHVIPTDHGIFHESFTPFFQFLRLLLHTEKFTGMTDRQGSSQSMRLFHFILLLGHCAGAIAHHRKSGRERDC